jgi:lipopolysaccharide transport system ATP-binding protein
MKASKIEETIIEVKHLSKQYNIGMDTTYKTLSESLTSAVWHPMKTLKDFRRRNETFWALKDVNFEIQRGEVLGIIGRNGAGKSTLLKILSRITYPTEGEVVMNGRVGSLLEVGTGFHPELSGRENIYFNGTILGMKKREIDEKFDEIVKFSGIEKFLDTPVKRYSSGMQVRLAFSVAAHLEPEILLVDEVLAVGDAEFQKKCLGKMGDVAKEGRTVLFVSHNMNAVEQLCSTCIHLEKGEIKNYSRDIRSAVRQYLFDQSSSDSASEWINEGNQFINPWFVPSSFYIGNELGEKIPMPVRNDDDVWIHIEGYLKENDPALTVGYAIYSEDGNLLFWSYQTDENESYRPKLKIGINHLQSKIPKRFLNEGIYRIEFISSLYFRQWICEPGKNTPVIFLLLNGGLSDSSYWTAKRPGLLAPVMNWKNSIK